MNKKLNKKLLNLIALCSGITATVAVGIGGIVYSIQEKNSGGGDEPVDQKVLPEEVYKFSEDGKTLLGFQDAFLNDSASPIYKDNFQDFHTMQIPERVTSINKNAFQNNFASTIPSFIKNLTFAEGSKCSSINSCAFQNCSSLTSVDLSNATSLSLINGCAFEYCSALTSVSFPESLNEIGNSAFINCSSLTSIDLSNCNQLTTINNGTFSECRSLTSVSFPSSLNQMARAFNNCSNLSSITWDAWNGNITLIESTPFSGVCPDGGTVTVTNPSGHDSDELLQYLLDNGGLPQTWAKNVGPELPDSVYDIDETTKTLKGFKSGIDWSQYQNTCDTMKIPAKVRSIKDEAFYANYSSTIPSFIKNLTFAENSNCSAINSCAFSSCSSLTSVVFPTNLTIIGGAAFSGCSSLTSVSFPESLNEIGNSAFLHCSSLRSINFPNNLSSIGNSAFINCSSLTSVTFPSSLKSIGMFAFGECSNLNSITWDRWTGSFDFLASDAFSGVCQTSGTVTVINPIDDAHNSAALLAYLKQNSELPESWIVA